MGALLLVGALVGAGCGSGGDDGATTDPTVEPQPETNALVDEGTPVEGGSLTIAVGAETDGWNPATSTWAHEGNLIGSSFMEPLVTFNSEGVAVPWLAESVVPNEDASRWTITLRQGIKFHDGTEMDAAAVVESLKFQGSPSALASVITGSLIGEPVATGKYTLDIPLTIRWGAFPTTLAGNYGYVMAPSMLAAPDNGANAPVGTAAFRFERAERDRFVRVTRFDDYWGGPCTVAEPSPDVVALCEEIGVPLGQKNGPFLDSIEFRPIPDSLQRSQALRAGDVDMIEMANASETAALRGDYQVVTDYGSDRTFVMLSASKPPFDNVHARRALAHATDRSAVLEAFSAGEEVESDTSPFDDTSPWGGLGPDEQEYPEFDLAKAAEEIELYKQDTGESTISFTLLGSANSDELELMQLLTEQWSRAGIDAKIETLKQEAVITTLVSGSSQAIMYHNYSWPDPDQNYVFWSKDFASPPIVINFSQFWNDDTQASIDLGRQSQDPEFRKEAYDELVKERNTNAIDVWLMNTPWAVIADQDVRGLNPFRVIGFSAFSAKPWVTAMWVQPES